MKKIFLLFVVVLLLCIGWGVVHAQSLSITDVSLSVTPSSPQANTQAIASISSFSTDLNIASIAWLLNGTIVSSGTGMVSFPFTMGSKNQTTTLSVNIITSAGEHIEKTLDLKPSNVDLIWQAETYTPPFYKGKTLFTHQSNIEFIAVPHILDSSGVEIPASNLVYTWTKNGTVLGDLSGYGKNTYITTDSIISKPFEMDVEVTSTEGDDITTSVDVNPVDPLVLFYQNDPAYGIQFQNALTGNITLSGTSEINVLAEPFFFGVTSFSDPSLSYVWSLNGSQIDNNTNLANRIFRQPTTQTAGVSVVSVSVSSLKKILEQTSNQFNLYFKSSQTQSGL